MYLSDIVPLMTASAEFRALDQALKAKERALWVDGLTAPARALLLAALRTRTARAPMLVLVPGADHADQLSEDLIAFGVPAPRIYPQLSVSDASDGAAPPADLGTLRDRLQALQDLAAGAPTLILAPIAAALQPVPDPAHLRDTTLRLRPGDRVSLDQIAVRLTGMGYDRVTIVEEAGQFAIRGGILDLFPLNETQPARVDLFGDEVETIRALDLATQRSLQPRDQLFALPAATAGDSKTATLLDYLPAEALIVLEDPRQMESRWEEYVSEHARGEAEDAQRQARVTLATATERMRRHRTLTLTLGARSIPWESGAREIPMSAHMAGSFAGGLAAAIEAIDEWRSARWKVILASDRADRLVEMLAENQVPVTRSMSDLAGASDGPLPAACLQGSLSAGFVLPWLKVAILTDGEVFGARKVRRPRRVAREGQRITSFTQLKEGDFVVHLHHGIGRYRGLVKQDVDGAERDYLFLEYADSARLYVPVDQIDRITKYIGSEEHPPQVHHIGEADWQRTKQRARAKVREMAGDLVKLYASRQAAQGHAFSPDTPWQQEMEDSFIYEETPDQLTAIHEVKEGMQQPQPMDRLICGDVGYGKTEVAIRAAFKAVMDGKQVLVLVPTTVLAQQHFNTFTERLAAFPVTVEMLSRFRSPKQQARVAAGLRDGSVDIVIGTHRLLSKDVQPRDLGMVIVDEEQRFGVAHKEQLKQMRTSVDVLTLTATPIPRTLHMSLSGIRDMSVINDPPEGRTPIKTICSERDDRLIREAIVREIDRDGQIYFVHNRVETIDAVAERIRRLVPHARVAVGHGQMPEDQLEKVMLDLYDREFDVLVCTTIIESGLDIPNVNTILIDDAPHMGLAQLYQLRGRVGRSPRQAYCYLLFDPRKALTETAEKRLEAIREFTQLGSGFQIALRDLEIRGAGNLLGADQHGFMLSVGFELYCRMIAEAVRELQGQAAAEEFVLPTADLPVDAHLPKEYVPDDRQRLDIYRRIPGIRNQADVQALEEELRDRFGKEPQPVRNLLDVLRLRVAAGAVGVEGIQADGEKLLVKMSMARRLTDKQQQRLWRDPAARRPGTRWVLVQHDRVVVELQGGQAMAAATAVVRALENLAKPEPKPKPTPRPVATRPRWG